MLLCQSFESLKNWPQHKELLIAQIRIFSLCLNFWSLQLEYKPVNRSALVSNNLENLKPNSTKKLGPLIDNQ